MIPLKLSLSGFLSYREPVTLNLEPITLACISGPNGAGKSSLLDALTWVLFGQARQRGDGIIHADPQVTAAQVQLDFAYEGNVYRVHRVRTRGKSTMLEFHIRTPEGKWKPLTERSLRETQARIEETLRMDYDTFVHASFFLQGEADKFSRERPAKRKEVLARILGLQVWEDYRQAAAERRRAAQNEVERLEARMEEMRAEIRQEEEIRTQLQEVEAHIARLEKQAQEQEKLLREYARIQASLEQQQALVDEIARQIAHLEARQSALTAQLAQRQAEEATHQALLAREKDIRAAHARLQEVRAELARFDDLARRFHALEAQRQPHLRAIAEARAKIEEALSALERRAQEAAQWEAQQAALQEQLQAAEETARAAEARLQAAEAAQSRLANLREQLGQLDAERRQLHEQAEEAKAHIAQLEQVTAPECPLCGQPLTETHRASILSKWQTQLETLREAYREKNERIKALREEYEATQEDIGRLDALREQHRRAVQAVEGLRARLRSVEERLAAWKQGGKPDLEAQRQRLEAGDFAHEARQALQALDDQLRALGYDPDAHEDARREEQTLRQAEEDLRALEKAQAALAPIRREMDALAKELKAVEKQLRPLRDRHAQAVKALTEARSAAPDVEAAERGLADVRERIAELQKSRGGLQQVLSTIGKYKSALNDLAAQRAEAARLVGRYQTLKEAFGKNGVPALLIEQAVPLLEEEANRLLERLTNGQMRLTLLTQRPYKDSKRRDMKETLDIVVSDGYGQRDYESYSGGEAFRVDFALRVALARVLAHRAGARLQTLVIDEGFGSQDAEGRQRLVEAIRTVQQEFAKILVVTHIESLKELFPARIEVQKTPNGSQAEVIFT